MKGVVGSAKAFGRQIMHLEMWRIQLDIADRVQKHLFISRLVNCFTESEGHLWEYTDDIATRIASSPGGGIEDSKRRRWES